MIGDIPDLIAPILEDRGGRILALDTFLVKRAGRVLYYRHYLANKLLTFLNNVLTDLNFTDVETGYKAMRADIARRMVISSWVLDSRLSHSQMPKSRFSVLRSAD